MAINKITNILIIEDCEDDAFLISRELEKCELNAHCTRVTSSGEIETIWPQQQWDIILSDYNIPNYNVMEALRIVRNKDPEIPFVVVSGSIGEETAVEILKAGISDYVMKTNLSRLPSAVERAVKEAETKTLLKTKEFQLLHAQKMEAIGRLAGGIAHDFNNILAVAFMNCDLALRKLNQDHPASMHIEQIQKVCKKAESVTRQLLAFGSLEKLEARSLSVNEIFLNLKKMMQLIVGENIKLEFQLSDGIKYINADPTQIEQIIMNLVINARDAITKNSGRIIVTTSPRIIGENHSSLKPGRYVSFSVQDNGDGMSTEVKNKIFEPFFTTKGPQKGSGLGLATVFGIIKSLDGWIEVESAIGKGTTFNIYIPETEKIETSRTENELIEVLPEKLTGNILLLEDEEDLKEVITDVLEKLGLKVSAPVVTEKFDIQWIANQKKIDLLITDVVMPGPSGPSRAAMIKELFPESKVLFMSGHLEEVLDDYDLAHEEAFFLKKPFNTQMLIRKIYKVFSKS